jgi:hypothetical protein
MGNHALLYGIAALVGVVVLLMLIKLIVKVALGIAAVAICYVLFAASLGLPSTTSIYHHFHGQASADVKKAATKASQNPRIRAAAKKAAIKAAHNKAVRKAALDALKNSTTTSK